MQVFWSKGYKGASLHDLTEAMGLSKSSFYDTFGSKHELFLAAIRRYEDTVVDCLVDKLDGTPSGRAAIESVLEGVVECTAQRDAQRGCFLANCANEVALEDPDAAARVREGFERVEDAFHRAVVRGQVAGEISRERDSRALARFLATTGFGMRLRAKADHDRAALADIARIALSALA